MEVTIIFDIEGNIALVTNARNSEKRKQELIKERQITETRRIDKEVIT